MNERLARAGVSAVLRRVRAGRIDVYEAGGRHRGFGPIDSELRAGVEVYDPAFWSAVPRGSVGLGESYVEGLGTRMTSSR